MWTVCIHYVQTYPKWQSNTPWHLVLSSWKSKNNQNLTLRMAYTRDKTILNSKCKPWLTNSRLHYSQARIPTSWCGTVAHHDRTSLINRCTQHTQNEQYLERIIMLYKVYSVTYIVQHACTKQRFFKPKSLLHDCCCCASSSELYRLSLNWPFFMCCVDQPCLLRQVLSIFLQSWNLTTNFKSK